MLTSDTTYLPRLSTPEPYDVPRWDDYDPLAALLPTANPVDLGAAPAAPSPVAMNTSSLMSMSLKSPSEMLPELFAYSDAKKSYDVAQRGAQAWNQEASKQAGSTSPGTGAKGLNATLWQRLSQANAGMKAAGLGEFGLTSGYRSIDRQRELYNAAPAWKRGKWIAAPGKSKHNYGLAADLKLTKAQQNWLDRNGKQYGLYRPMSYESWHWQMA